jgi:hypothetical protein
MIFAATTDGGNVMTDRKVFADSVTPLPDQPGLTPHGLMIHAEKPTDRNEKMTLLFSVGISASAQADLEARVTKGEIIPPEELRESYRSDQNDLNALVSWLKKQGYKIVQVTSDGTGVLRARCDRPGGRRAAEKANELTSPHFRTQGQRPALYRLKRVL